MSDRCLGLRDAARAFPPFGPPKRPSATAAGFFRFVVRLARMGRPVAIATTLAARWLRSSGRLLLLERFGIHCTVLSMTTEDKDRWSHRQKLKRARAHLDTFYSTVQDFLKTDPYEDVSEQYGYTEGQKIIKPNQVLVIVHFKKREGRELPPDLPFLAGDAIYNLRSALDHLAYALVEKNLGGAPKTEQCMFPIHSGLGSYMDAGVRACRDMSNAAKDIIQKLQPYHAEDRKNPDALANHQLGLLNKLSNIDKHRHLVLSGAVTTKTSATLNPSSRDVRVAIAQRTDVQYGPFDDQTDILRLLVDIIGPNPYVKVDTHMDIDVSFPKTGPAPGQFVHPVLVGIYNHIVREVFTPLEQLLD